MRTLFFFFFFFLFQGQFLSVALPGKFIFGAQVQLEPHRANTPAVYSASLWGGGGFKFFFPGLSQLSYFLS